VRLVLRVADRVRRLWWRLAGPRTVGVRGVVRDADGRVLLVRHTYGPPLWHLPGGGVKRRESLTDAVRRELREEVGIIAGELRLHGTFSNLQEGKSDHIAVFIVEDWTERKTTHAEIDARRFVALDSLPDDVSPGTRRRLGELDRPGASTGDW
jgi:ADP-ribose pyrophosphatase YjhB (NUDIX family)